ncbi:MAG: phosphotransferase, partial [Anaerolineae bacterium]|nr:phosphotransferase [Anaerolineae bacterium]
PGDENMGIFTGAQLLTMQEVAGKVHAAMQNLGRGEEEFGIIHADLLLHNILFHEGEARGLDWEYSGWGYFLYDLTPLLWQMKPLPNYAEIQAALWDGYTSIRPLTEEHRNLLETLIAGRQVASMRWVAANQRNPHYAGKVERILAQRTAELRNFLDTGTLNRST